MRGPVSITLTARVVVPGLRSEDFGTHTHTRTSQRFATWNGDGLRATTARSHARAHRPPPPPLAFPPREEDNGNGGGQPN